MKSYTVGEQKLESYLPTYSYYDFLLTSNLPNSIMSGLLDSLSLH